jgi:hypothetical protein
MDRWKNGKKTAVDHFQLNPNAAKAGPFVQRGCFLR